MSPEQARGLAVDKRTDIWAFGCVLYEMLTGRVAFAGDTVSDTIAEILEREPDWSLLPAAAPAPIRRLLLRASRRIRSSACGISATSGSRSTAIDEALPGSVERPLPAPARRRLAAVGDGPRARLGDRPRRSGGLAAQAAARGHPHPLGPRPAAGPDAERQPGRAHRGGVARRFTTGVSGSAKRALRQADVELRGLVDSGHRELRGDRPDIFPGWPFDRRSSPSAIGRSKKST